MTTSIKLSATEAEAQARLAQYKREALSACKDFCYPDEVAEKIKVANTCGEISSIMTRARHTYL